MSEEAPDSVENSEATVPARNGGRLLPGGKKGNRGGTGRPPDKIREALRGALWKHRARLEEFAQSDDPSVAMKAMDMLAKYGLGTPTAAVDSEGNQQNLPVLLIQPAK